MNPTPRESFPTRKVEGSNKGNNKEETPRLPGEVVFPLDFKQVTSALELLKHYPQLTPLKQNEVGTIYERMMAGLSSARASVEGIKSKIRMRAARGESKRIEMPLTYRLASAYVTLALILAACVTVTAAPDTELPGGQDNQPVVTEVVPGGETNPTPSEEVPNLDEINVNYGKYEEYQDEIGVAVQGDWNEIAGQMYSQGLALPINIEIADFSNSPQSTMIKIVGVEEDSGYPTDPDGSTYVTISRVEGHEGERLFTTNTGANAANPESPVVEQALGADGLPVGLDASGRVVAHVDILTGNWTAGSKALAPEVSADIPQATREAETENLAQPTMDNVEISGGRLREFLVDQFPRGIDLSDVEPYSSFTCISDEVVVGRYEIGNSGIYAIASAECWYEQDGQQYAVLLPLVITDNVRMVIIGFANQEYDADYERLMTTGADWYAFLEDRDFIGRGHIFTPSISLPVHEKGTNQGLGNEQLRGVYTQEMLSQFATSGDPNVLPKVIINGVEYDVMIPFNVGMSNNTFNRPEVNPYVKAQ
jgi:hypothetical protein